MHSGTKDGRSLAFGVGNENTKLSFTAPGAPVSMNRLFKMAIAAGVESAVRLHINRGDHVNSRDDKGLTPLMIAAARNKAEICRLLLESKADPRLLDPLGRDALSIAQGANAVEAAAIIQRATAPLSTTADVAKASEIIEDEEALPFSASSWEPEVEATIPLVDESLAIPAATVQTAISLHVPLDSSASWDELEIALPSFAEPLARNEPIESRDELRLLLLRSIREGSIPYERLEELTGDSSGDARNLRALVNELGAEVDERFEYWAEHEDFTVLVDPNASEDEEDILCAAFDALDALNSDDHSTLRHLLREAQHHPLLSASEEILLGQSMEAEIERALDALAGWPAGVERILELAKQASSGAQGLGWIATDSADEAPADEAGLEASSTEDPLQSSADDDSDDVLTSSVGNAHDVASQIAALGGARRADGRSATGWAEQRAILGEILFRRSFLMELADHAATGHACAQDYARSIGKYRRARDRLTLANLRLAASIARKYQGSSIPLADLIQNSRIGLLRAVDKFDWRKGYRFSTYATWWIRQAVSRSVADTCRCIRVPVHIHAAAYNAERASRAWEERNGREPSPTELADALSIPLRKVFALIRARQEPESLEHLLEKDAIDPDLHDALVLPDPAEALEAKELRTQLDIALSSFKPVERLVIRLRFGLGDDDSRTLEEVGQVIGVTRERIRQIEAKTLRRLKNPKRNVSLRPWVASEERKEAPPSAPDAKNDPAEVCSAQATGAPRRSQEIRALASRPSEPISAASLVNGAGGGKALDRLLAEAAALGVVIEDGRAGLTGELWVRIDKAFDGRSRSLIRRLFSMGFSYVPGAGFWR